MGNSDFSGNSDLDYGKHSMILFVKKKKKWSP